MLTQNGNAVARKHQKRPRAIGRDHHFLSVYLLKPVVITCPTKLFFSLALIERAQFAQNPRVYAKDGFKDVLHKDGFAGSWLDWFLLESESMCGKFFRLNRFCKLLNMRDSESQAL